MFPKKTYLALSFGLAGLLACPASVAATVLSLDDKTDTILNEFTIQTNLSKRALASTNSENTLVELSLNKDSKGILHGRYQQYYRGIPVWGHQVLTHGSAVQRGSKRSPTLLSGQLVEGIGKDVSAAAANSALYSPEKMLTRIKQRFIQERHVKFPGQEWNFSQERAKLVYFIDAEENAHVAYEISFFADTKEEGNPTRPFYIIDATTEQTLKAWDGLTHEKVGTGPGGNKKIGKYDYGIDFDFLDLTKTVLGMCQLENEHVRTVHMKNRRNNPGGAKGFLFECFEQASDEANGAYSPLNDAHFFGGVIFDMYNNWYGIAPLTQKLVLRAHYGRSYENAFWDGGQMTFGDGGSSLYPLVSIDVVAHEVSHGVTEQNSDLSYSGQSGGLNESFSDMAGKAAEFYMRNSNTWVIGGDISKDDEGFRYMDKPTLDGSSIDDARKFKSSLDVHHSSGVFNKAFYLLATSEGWDTHKAFDVMLHANRFYWTSSINFINAAKDVLKATLDLGYETDAVIAAFYEVGIECDETPSCSLRK